MSYELIVLEVIRRYQGDQGELAEKIGIGRNYLSNLKGGTLTVTERTARQALAEIGKDFGDLSLFGDATMEERAIADKVIMLLRSPKKGSAIDLIEGLFDRMMKQVRKEKRVMRSRSKPPPPVALGR